MRQWADVLDYQPVLFASLGAAAGGSVTGNSVDVQGFADIMAVITYACIGGTTDTFGYLTVRFEESDTFGTGASYAVIDDGMINPTMTIDTVYGTALTYPFLASTTIYERLTDSRRKRFIRPVAIFTGTAGCMFGLSVGVMLGRPRDTLYIKKATVYASNVDECYQPRLA